MRPLRMDELAGKKPRKKGDDEAERLLLFQLRAYGLPEPTLQHRFAAPERQWRWDFAWPAFRMAVEVQGGIWMKGAHAHPTDILRNMDKHNDAALLGWRWFQFTPNQVKDGVAALWMQRFFLRQHPITPQETLCTPPDSPTTTSPTSTSTSAPSTTRRLDAALRVAASPKRPRSRSSHAR